MSWVYSNDELGKRTGDDPREELNSSDLEYHGLSRDSPE